MRTANGQDDYMSVKYGKTSGMRPAGAAGAKAGCGCRKALIEFFIHLVWVVLEIVNVILIALQAISGAIENCLSSYDKKPKHVVIVGASFGGLAAQRELAGRKDVKVTLIDFKKYFEYTPGVLRCFVQPEFLKELTCPLPSTRNELLTGTMTGCSEEAVTLRTSTGGEQKVSFDYLVLAVGSTYSDPIKPTEAETTLAERTSSWGVAANKLANAQTVIVVGAGPVGVELAGEILTVYPDKTVTFVDMAPTILPGFDEAAATFTKQWFKDRGAKMMLGEAIEKIGTETVLLKSGVELQADVVYKCVGVMPNTAMLKDSSMFEGTWGFRDSINVNDHLQVAGNHKVYCVGDMMNHSSRELKLGHTAEVNAHLAAHNILADLHGKPLLTYPRGVTGADTTPKIWCLSLGRYYAVVGFNGLVMCGWWVAVLKWLLEWTKVAAAGERPIGIFFWKMADMSSNWLNRTILPPKKAGSQNTDDLEKGISEEMTDYTFPHPMLDFLNDPVWGALGNLIMRVVTASLVLHHGLDKLGNVQGFSQGVIATYFTFLPGPPVFWTYLSAAFEIVGSFCLTFGIFARPAALLLAGTMANAILFHLMKFGLQSYPFNPPNGGAYTFEPSLSFCGVFGLVVLAGPGRFSCGPHWPKWSFLKNPMFADAGNLIVRVVTASLILHHGLDKLGNVQGFSQGVIATYFTFLPGPPVFWTYLSAAFELLGSLCLTIGLFTRPAAVLLAGTMANAILFHLMKFGLQNYPFNPAKGGAYTFEPSLSFIGVCAFVALAGPGRYAMRPNGF